MRSAQKDLSLSRCMDKRGTGLTGSQIEKRCSVKFGLRPSTVAYTQPPRLVRRLASSLALSENRVARVARDFLSLATLKLSSATTRVF